MPSATGRMQRRRFIAVVAILVLATIALAIGYPLYRQRSLDAAFETITSSFDEAAVIALMGEPQQIDSKADLAFWDDRTLGDDVAKQVVRQYRFEVNLPPVPVSWTIGFDASGHVISKHRLD